MPIENFEEKIYNQEKTKTETKLARADDWQEFANIRLEMLREEPASFIGTHYPSTPEINDKEGWQHILEDEDRFFLVTKDHAGTVIGMVGALSSAAMKNKPDEVVSGSWYIQWLYVNPNDRNSPMGLNMFKKVLEEVKIKGGKGAFAFVLKSNTYLPILQKAATRFGFHEKESENEFLFYNNFK